MAYDAADQQQETVSTPAAGSPLLELVRLLARLAARDAIEQTAVDHWENSGPDHSEPEDTRETEV